jgi:cell wall-associated NlpC family hydrolase
MAVYFLRFTLSPRSNRNPFMNTSAFKINRCFFIRLLLPLAVMLFSGCAGVPEKEPAAPRVESPLVAYALSLQGVPYRYGKASPEEGFDCSGFVKHVYQKQGIDLPRTVKDMASSLPQIPKDDVHSGDLVFFNTNGNAFSHVGIYVDDSRFIHAPSRRTGKVLVSSLKNRYWEKHYTGARRPRRF